MSARAYNHHPRDTQLSRPHATGGSMSLLRSDGHQEILPMQAPKYGVGGICTCHTVVSSMPTGWAHSQVHSFRLLFAAGAEK